MASRHHTVGSVLILFISLPPLRFVFFYTPFFPADGRWSLWRSAISFVAHFFVVFSSWWTPPFDQISRIPRCSSPFHEPRLFPYNYLHPPLSRFFSFDLEFGLCVVYLYLVQFPPFPSCRRSKFNRCQRRYCFSAANSSPFF